MANEKRLIDANVLIQKLQEAVTHKGMGAAIAGVLIRYIEKLPTVDAVEVVRCKDCKHSMKSHLQPRHAKNYLCRHSWEGEYHEPDHFCSYGERKDNG